MQRRLAPERGAPHVLEFARHVRYLPIRLGKKYPKDMTDAAPFEQPLLLCCGKTDPSRLHAVRGWRSSPDLSWQRSSLNALA